MTGWTYHPELLATPVPRYTSYPTAAEFSDSVGRSELEQALAEIAPDEPLSLYVHIPFCHEICWYCGCNTGAANRSQRLASYLEGLRTEIALVAGRLGGRGKVGRIAFGGGSPNALRPQVFADLLAELRETFAAPEAAISIELDPRSLDASWYDVIAAAGVERASLGVQTLDPRVQQAIGRVQPQAAIAAAVAGLRAADVRSLNFDVMYGLPGQDEPTLRDTLVATVGMRPERIALFGYAHVPHLIARQRRIDASALPDSAARFRQAALGHRLLTAAGYQPVGFDHYALPGDSLAVAARSGGLRRNFQGFTDDPAEALIGLGASAISQFPQLLVQNEKNAGRYRMSLSAGRLAAERGITRTAIDLRRGRAIEQLLCSGIADAAGLLGEAERARLEPMVARGLMTIDGPIVRLEDSGWPYARVIASAFDSYRQQSPGRFSNAV